MRRSTLYELVLIPRGIGTARLPIGEEVAWNSTGPMVWGKSQYNYY